MRILIIALIAFASLPLHAAEPVEEETVTWYDVELVVFRNLDTRSSETWPPDAGIPDIENARPLFPPPTVTRDTTTPDPRGDAGNESASRYPGAPTPYVPLDESAYRLNDIVDSLQRSSKYEPILHVAWTQPPLERSQAPHLRVTLPGTIPVEETEISGNGMLDQDEPLLGRSTDADSGEALPKDAPGFLRKKDDHPPLARPLDGVIQLYVSRYLHLDVDLLYLPDDLNAAVLGEIPAATDEWTEEDRREREQRRRDIIDALARGDITLEEAEILSLEPEKRVFQGFRLNQYRRMRSRDIHYFDHPVYGMIVTITPREVTARTLEMNDTARPR